MKCNMGIIHVVSPWVRFVMYPSKMLYCHKISKIYDPEIPGKIIAMIAMAPEMNIVIFAVPMAIGCKFDRTYPVSNPKISSKMIKKFRCLIYFLIKYAEARISQKKNAQICWGYCSSP